MVYSCYSLCDSLCDCLGRVCWFVDIQQCLTKAMHVLRYGCWHSQQFVLCAVTDMFYDAPYNLDANEAQCFEDYGVRPQYNWAAYK